MKTFLAVLSLVLVSVLASAQTIHVVTTTTDLAALVREIGGTRVSVDALCRADQDPHAFEILPSQIGLVGTSDVVFKVGVGLDPWIDDVVRSSNRPNTTVISCAHGVAILRDHDEHEHPGHHPHAEGNPHYWLGPTNLTAVAATIRDGLSAADPAGSADYAADCDRFTARLDTAIIAWRDKLAGCRGAALVTSHPAWDYFARDFSLAIAGTVSPMPGAEPSPVELALLENRIRSFKIAIFLREPFTPERIPAVLERDTRIRVMLAPPSVGGVAEVTDIWSHFDYLVDNLARLCGQGQ